MAATKENSHDAMRWRCTECGRKEEKSPIYAMIGPHGSPAPIWGVTRCACGGEMLRMKEEECQLEK
jgi:hypothetical protein